MLLVFWSCSAPIFFPKILSFATSYPPTSTKFFCVLYWKYCPTKPKYNNYSKCFYQLKIELCALMGKRNLCLALCYFTCICCPKLVIYSNQIKLPLASSADYIISQMSLSFCKVFLLYTGTQNAKNIHMKCFPRVHFTSVAFEKTIKPQTSEVNSTSLHKHYHDWIYQVTIGDDADIFSVPKILRLHVQPCQKETSTTKFGQ